MLKGGQPQEVEGGVGVGRPERGVVADHTHRRTVVDAGVDGGPEVVVGLPLVQAQERPDEVDRERGRPVVLASGDSGRPAVISAERRRSRAVSGLAALTAQTTSAAVRRSSSARRWVPAKPAAPVSRTLRGGRAAVSPLVGCRGRGRCRRPAWTAVRARPPGRPDGSRTRWPGTRRGLRKWRAGRAKPPSDQLPRCPGSRAQELPCFRLDGILRRDRERPPRAFARLAFRVRTPG